ncbi:MAG: hypothetical protein ACLU3I_17600 [Acutalibacteraceae bacterium]
MLELKQIVKDYQAGDTAVHALKGVSIRFRRHEFVAVLGPSGCGKDDASEHHRRTGSIYLRRSCHRRTLDEGLFRAGLGYLPQPFHRFRLSEL